jgi:hypothetical protein
MPRASACRRPRTFAGATTEASVSKLSANFIPNQSFTPLDSSIGARPALGALP